MEKTGDGASAAYEIIARVGRVEAKLDQVLALLQSLQKGEVDRSSRRQDDEAGLLETLTVKQHAVLQMLFNGKSNAEIAERLGISENTAKVHVRLLAKKAGGHKRSQIVARFKRAFDEIEESRYQALTKGLPKSWDHEWGSGSEQYDDLLRNDG